MGFWNSNNTNKAELPHHWKNLDKIDQLTKIENDSADKPILIFKHSTRCGISAQALWKLESEWHLDPEELDFYYLDLITHRPISSEIASRFQVVHQSPQILLIRNGKAVFDTSHHAINVHTVIRALEL